MSQRLKAVFAALLLWLCRSSCAAGRRSSADGAPNPRIALVIGNATYRDAALATPANDAGLVAQTLQAAGFDVVGARDLDGQSLRTAFRDFLQKAAAAGPDMQAFVYLAGRAVQYNGDNYFVPVDARDQSRRRRADRSDPHVRFHPRSCRDARAGRASSFSTRRAPTLTRLRARRSRRGSLWSIRSAAN